MSHKLIRYASVDFDKTLSLLDESQFPSCANPELFGIKILNEFRRRGGKLILNTCRSGDHLDIALDFCKCNGLEFDRVNDHLKEQIDNYLKYFPDSSISRKIYADIYIDDKNPHAIFLGHIDWDEIEYLLLGPQNWPVAA